MAGRQSIKMKRSAGSIVFDTFNILIILALSFVFLYPIVYVISVSVSDTNAIAMGQVKFLPIGFQSEAYQVIFSDKSILLAYANTIFYSLASTLVTLFMTSLTAYPLAVKRFRGKSGITVYFAITMFVSGGMVPAFLLINALHMYNTIWAIIIPGALGMWNIVIVRTFFQDIPVALRESALIDGASDFRILASIYLPLSKPVLATIALFSVVGQWNNYFGPLLYLADQSKYPLQVVLRKLIISNELRGTGIEQGMRNVNEAGMLNDVGLSTAVKMAAIVVSIGPIILAYPFLQKYFVKGMLVGSIKG